jgi:DNA-directed RNA polymerase specialized sigma24 family protein
MNHPAFHDTEIIMQHLQEGDIRTFKSILNQFYPALCYFANKLTDNPAIAETIAEDAMTALWQARQQFNNPGMVNSFLYDHAAKASVAFAMNRQKGIEEDTIWVQVQHEIIRAEVLRHLHHQKYNRQVFYSDSNHPEPGTNAG